MAQTFTLTVNGHRHPVSCEPDTPLLYILRNDLGLKAAKFGCGAEQCGACTVIVDGQAVPSCRLPVRSVQGREITTLEGLGTREDLHPIQQAFIDEQAIQCGFCVPGMIISAKVLLDRHPDPTDAEIRAEMSGNLCRCGVYDRIRRAVKRAAGKAEPTPSWKKGPKPVPDPQAQEPAVVQTDGMVGTLAYTPGIDDWIRIGTDGTVTVLSGKVELGQHIKMALAMIAAEELGVAIDRVRLVSGDTAQTPNEGYTAGSMSMETSGNAIRNAAAEAKHILMNRAAESLEAPLKRLAAADGVITDPAEGRRVTYWDLMGGKSFDSDVMGVGVLKQPEDYQVVGRPLLNADLIGKVTGEPCFVHDMQLPGMVHGRVARPPNHGAKLVSLDRDALSEVPGILAVVRNGSFLGVIAEREEQAEDGVNCLALAARWEPGPDLPDQGSLIDNMKQQPHGSYLLENGMAVGDPPPPVEAPPDAAHTLSATYFRPYQMHGSIGPSASVAQLVDGKMTVWSHSQGPFPLRSAIAQVLEMNPEDIRVIHRDGPGCYGHNGADDAAMDAALLAREVPGRAVQLKWARRDEHGWEPYGPAMIVDTQASLGEKGDVIDWNLDVWSCDAGGRPRPDREGGSGLLAAWYLERPFKKLSRPPVNRPPQSGSTRNAEPLYAFPRQRTVHHFLPGSPLRVSSHRGLGAYANTFAIESFMDELSRAVGVDPIEFRMRHLTDERAKDVIEAAAEKAHWGTGKGTAKEHTGRGFGFTRYKNRTSYIAVALDVIVNPAEGQIYLEKAVIAGDSGQIVNPDGISNQLEGAFLQAASWTLREQVTFDRCGITSLDWHSYPILRFRDAPKIEVVLIDRPGQPYTGVGEGALGPVPAAIANAVFDAVGVRLREIPFLPARVKASMGRSS